MAMFMMGWIVLSNDQIIKIQIMNEYYNKIYRYLGYVYFYLCCTSFIGVVTTFTTCCTIEFNKLQFFFFFFKLFMDKFIFNLYMNCIYNNEKSTF